MLEAEGARAPVRRSWRRQWTPQLYHCREIRRVRDVTDDGSTTRRRSGDFHRENIRFTYRRSAISVGESRRNAWDALDVKIGRRRLQPPSLTLERSRQPSSEARSVHRECGLIVSRLDYCNSLFAHGRQFIDPCSTRVQNAATRLVGGLV